ncbi:MAG: Arc family DNA-binding protein [Planctomycetes bacterium]|nr:Arc family DNA-binding protein [Planctomycetota bacterium]
MSVALSIERLPDRVAAELGRRAAEHKRSLEAEALAILEASLATGDRISIGELHAKVQAMGLRSPSESVAMLREDRYGSHRR